MEFEYGQRFKFNDTEFFIESLRSEQGVNRMIWFAHTVTVVTVNLVAPELESTHMELKGLHSEIFKLLEKAKV